MIISKFADAVMDVAKSLHEDLIVLMYDECKTEGKECFAFRIWVNNGGELKRMKTEVSIEKDMGTRFEDIRIMGLTMTLTFLYNNN